MHNSDGGRGTFFCWIDSQRKFHYETESVGFHLVRYDLDRNHYLFVGNESVASPVELGNSGTSVIPRTARSDYDHRQEANELNPGSQKRRFTRSAASCQKAIQLDAKGVCWLLLPRR